MSAPADQDAGEIVDAEPVPDTPTGDQLATRDAHPPAAVGGAPGLPAVRFSDEQVAIIRDTVCKPRDRPATDGELGLFLARCQRTGLDPLAGQIHAVFRKDNRAGGVEKMSIQTGIDGLRLVAQRTGEFAGSSREWCSDDGVWRGVWLDRGHPAAARVVVRRIVHGHVVEQEGVATWAEYGDDRNVWKGKPAHMLAKCAEALALRSMFPAELSGLYTGDEMAQADAADDGARPTAPAAPAWAATAGADQWQQLGERWSDLCLVLQVSDDVARDAWRRLMQPLAGARPVGLVAGLTAALAALDAATGSTDAGQ